MKSRIALIFTALFIGALAIVLPLAGRVEPQHTISRQDIVTAALADKFNRSRIPDTNITAVIWVHLNRRATAGFKKYWDEHPDRDIQIARAATNVANIALYSAYTNEQTGDLEMDLFFTNYDEATKAYTRLCEK